MCCDGSLINHAGRHNPHRVLTSPVLDIGVKSTEWCQFGSEPRYPVADRFSSTRKAFPEETWPASKKRLKCDDLEGSSGTLSETLAQSINDWSLDSSLIADLKETRGT